MMLKKGILRRVTISSLALLILLITYLFPTKLENTSYEQNLSYTDVQKGVVYLLDENQYVSRVNMVISNKETIEKVKEIIAILTIQGKSNEYIPNNFYGVIPIGTTLLNVTLEAGLLKLDFSKEFLNTSQDLERKMIESVVYSMPEHFSSKEIA